MPKINQQVIESVFYLYQDRANAESGTNALGTGFVVSHQGQLYAVSNRHVVAKFDAPVIRLNTKDGVDIFEFGPEDWESIPGRADVAVVPISIDQNRHSVKAIPSTMFVSEQRPDIGVGDDVFMVGLFVDHEGREKNNPMARFGNVSMLAKKDAPIKHGTESYVSYICDMHSRSGFSGSPVFMYRTLGGNLTRGDEVVATLDHLDAAMARQRSPSVNVKLQARTVFQLLGIHWGHFPERWELENLGALSEDAVRQNLITEKTYVQGFSGMTCVAPAWTIMELLNMPKLKELREAAKTKGTPKVPE